MTAPTIVARSKQPPSVFPWARLKRLSRLHSRVKFKTSVASSAFSLKEKQRWQLLSKHLSSLSYTRWFSWFLAPCFTQLVAISPTLSSFISILSLWCLSLSSRLGQALITYSQKTYQLRRFSTLQSSFQFAYHLLFSWVSSCSSSQVSEIRPFTYQLIRTIQRLAILIPHTSRLSSLW